MGVNCFGNVEMGFTTFKLFFMTQLPAVTGT